MLNLAKIRITGDIRDKNLLHMQNSFKMISDSGFEGIVAIAINSLGGNVDIAFQMKDLMFEWYKHKVKVWKFITVGVLDVFSAACIPFLSVARANRWMLPDSSMLIHENFIVSSSTNIAYNSSNLCKVPQSDQAEFIRDHSKKKTELCQYFASQLNIHPDNFADRYFDSKDYTFSPHELLRKGWIGHVGDPFLLCKVVHDFCIINYSIDSIGNTEFKL